MSDAQLFQLFGLIYFGLGLSGILDRDALKKMVLDFADSPALIYISGIVIIVPGFLLVTFHNVWAWEMGLVVTILGWLLFIKGFTLIAFPAFNQKICRKAAKWNKFFKIWPYIAVVVGLVILGLGICYDTGFCGCGV